MRVRAFVWGVAVTLALVGCKKEEAPKEEAAAEEGAAEEGAEEPEGAEEDAAGPLDLADLGLKMDASAGASVRTVAGSAMAQLGGGVAVTVKEAGRFDAETADKAKEEAESSYSAENVQSEALESGWAMTFENSGSAGKNYWVQARLDIDGKAYWCAATLSTEEQQASALAACKSLRK